MASSSCILKKSIPKIAILVVILGFFSFSSYGVFSITLTSFILTFYTIFFTFSKQKEVILEEPQDVLLLSSLQQESPKIEAISQDNLYSESESNDHHTYSSEDSDIDWSYSANYLGQSQECSDDSISDEESLIEIALPSGHYVEEEDSKFFKQQKFPDLMELLAEINDMNEEENLIEIDLSMGSIMCSRFEIEA